MTKRLLVGDIRKDLHVYDEVIKILSELKDAWQAIKSEEDASGDVYSKRELPESYSPRLNAY
jgi:flagellin-specific chaperone FliS